MGQCESKGKISTLCEAWLSMLSGHTHNLAYTIGGIDFDANIVCLAPQLHKLLSDADTDHCQNSYLAKLNHLKQVIHDVKKFQCDHVVVAKEEVSSILRPLTDELISRIDDAQQAIFNECERDALAKLDVVLDFTANIDMADIMNIKVVDNDILSRVLEYSKSEEMSKVVKGFVAAQNACK